MRGHIIVALLGSLSVASAACGKGGGGPGEHWSKRPVKTMSAKAGDVAFTIELPDGMRQTDDPKGKEVEFDFHIDGRVYTPEIRVSTGGVAKDLDEYKRFESKVATWLRAETLSDGFVASAENPNYPGKEDYLVYAYRTAGDKALACSGRVTRWSKGEVVKDKVAQVEKACLSIKIAP